MLAAASGQRPQLAPPAAAAPVAAIAGLRGQNPPPEPRPEPRPSVVIDGIDAAVCYREFGREGSARGVLLAIQVGVPPADRLGRGLFSL